MRAIRPSQLNDWHHRRRGLQMAAALLSGFVALAVGVSVPSAQVLAASAPPQDRPALTALSAAYAPPGCLNDGSVTRCLDVYFATVWTKNGWRTLYMNIYLPNDHQGLDPLLIYIPGGGWVIGDRTNCPGDVVAASGYAMACIEYRHSTEATFPAQIYDVKRAVRWLRANAYYFGLDPYRFGAWGDSAGGHLAALLGTSGGIQELEGYYGYTGWSSRVQAVADWYGLTDFTQVPPAFEQNVEWPVPDWMWQNYHQTPWYIYTVATTLLLGGPVSQHLDLARLANPLAWVDPIDPPFLILHGEADDIVPVEQSQMLADALRANGVPVTLIRDPWRGHSPSDQGGVGYGPQTIAETLAFFDQYLHGRP